ncbi:MAG TPA: N-acetylmuramoyl-L-alanine amidase-like domain-containing protein [Myxococcaceae bacterium]|nr:N-acetylmuramoyl-L-alanine amidase-like domain-containing protein [Myxococcaceae bacterium]
MSAVPLVLWLLGAAAGPVPAAAPERWADLPEAERVKALAALPDGPLSARLVAVSERFLGTPYGVSPLGEGQGKDPDPLIRFDLVDCLTYVEETIALALARAPGQVDPLLAALRYQKQVLYEDRNHLMEAQWLPSNVKKGFLREASARYGGADVQHAAKVITAATWHTPSSQALDLPEERQLVGRFPLDLVPLDKAPAHIREVPSGTLMLVVREDLPGKVTRITHLGFVVQKGKRTFFRHASRNPFARVVDEDVESFFTRNARYSKWRVDGVSLYEVLPRAP